MEELKKFDEVEAAKADQLDRLNKLIERKKWLNQLHIFQRFREVREERALKNWQRHRYYIFILKKV
jgi:hypothetical protein